jgi:uncharacterized protein (DUF1800 family)
MAMGKNLYQLKKPTLRYFVTMKISLFLLLAFISVNSYALSVSEARHFLSRTGFPPSFSEITPYLALTKAEAVEKRLSEIRLLPEGELSTEFELPYSHAFNPKKATKKQKQEHRKMLRKQTKKLKDWWMHELLTTTSPMTENLTLFWHNHFATSSQKVHQPALMAQQNLTIRANAAGNFRDFVKSMVKDPALITYLDNQRNRVNKPNENLARELLELFTLGEGHYSEQDIKEAARALSGESKDWKTGQYKFNEKAHDNTNKTIFKQTGNWDAENLVDLILQNKQASQFITQKLWAHYITTPISDNTLNKLSDRFYKNYELKPLIHNILMQPDFWQPQNVGTQIKSPINLVVGLYRQFEITTTNPRQLVKSTKAMGLNLFTPPNVKGWVSNEDWVTSSSLIKRQSFIQNNLRGMKIPKVIKNKIHTKQAWLDLLIAKPNQIVHKQDSNKLHSVKDALNDLRYQLQ